MLHDITSFCAKWVVWAEQIIISMSKNTTLKSWVIFTTISFMSLFKTDGISLFEWHRNIIHKI